MLSTRSSEKSLVIKQDDKFFSMLLSRDLSMSRTNKNGSFRGLPSSVPFKWESQPGTPKHQFYSSASQLLLPPPLTPPPSYYSAHSHINQIKIRQTSSSKSTGLFNKLNFFKWRVNNNAHQPSSPSISSYSFSSSPSSFSCSSTTTRSSSLRRIRFGSWGGSSSSNSSKIDHEEDSCGGGVAVSPSSTLCFMTRKKVSRNAVWDLQKKELMSVHGSN